MTKLRPALYLLGFLLLGVGWLSFCHDPAVRAEAAKIAADAKADSVRAENDKWKAQYLSREAEREFLLQAHIHEEQRLGKGIVSMWMELRGLDSLKNAPRDSLLGQIAVRDSIIGGQKAIIAEQDSSLGLYRAMVAARDTIIAHQAGDLKALLVSRDAWRKQSERRWFCVGGVGGTLGISGNAAVGLGATCGYRLN